MENPKLSYFVIVSGFAPRRFRTRLPVVVGQLFPLFDRRHVVAAGWEGDRYVVHVA
mgnify:FL=1